MNTIYFSNITTTIEGERMIIRAKETRKYKNLKRPKTILEKCQEVIDYYWERLPNEILEIEFETIK